VIDADTLERGGPRQITLRNDDTPPPAGRGWIRRIAPAGWRANVEPWSHAGAVRAAWLAWLNGWIGGASGINWLTTLHDLIHADNKLVQLAAARSIGITIPTTVVTNDPAAIEQTLGGLPVAKPLRPADYLTADGELRYVPAQSVSVATVAADVAAAPFLFQERLTAREHLRVVTVGTTGWSARLDATSRPLDWREQDEAHDSFEAAHTPAVAAPSTSQAHSTAGSAAKTGSSTKPAGTSSWT